VKKNLGESVDSFGLPVGDNETLRLTEDRNYDFSAAVGALREALGHLAKATEKPLEPRDYTDNHDSMKQFERDLGMIIFKYESWNKFFKREKL
jgi:hypothetical protein